MARVSSRAQLIAEDAQWKPRGVGLHILVHALLCPLVLVPFPVRAHFGRAALSGRMKKLQSFTRTLAGKRPTSGSISSVLQAQVGVASATEMDLEGQMKNDAHPASPEHLQRQSRDLLILGTAFGIYQAFEHCSNA